MQARPRALRVVFTELEYAEVVTAAGRSGTAVRALVAEATLVAARGGTAGDGSQLRQSLAEMMRAAGLVRRVGVNLNQAVRTLNATGQRPNDLDPAAAYCMRVVRRLDEAAEEARRRFP